MRTLPYAMVAGLLALALGGCGTAAVDDDAAADQVVVPEPVRPRSCHGGGVIFIEVDFDRVQESRSPLDAVRVHEQQLFAEPDAPNIVGHQLVEQSLPLSARPYMRVIAGP